MFPLGPIISLFNNLFFIRIDAAKLLFTRKRSVIFLMILLLNLLIIIIIIIMIFRPIAKKIGGLGIWEDVLQIMSVIGKNSFYLL